VGAIEQILAVEEIVENLKREYHQARKSLAIESEGACA